MGAPAPGCARHRRRHVAPLTHGGPALRVIAIPGLVEAAIPAWCAPIRSARHLARRGHPRGARAASGGGAPRRRTGVGQAPAPLFAPTRRGRPPPPAGAARDPVHRRRPVAEPAGVPPRDLPGHRAADPLVSARRPALGRERLRPVFVSAAAALQGGPCRRGAGTAGLRGHPRHDDGRRCPRRGERDRIRVRVSGDEAAQRDRQRIDVLPPVASGVPGALVDRFTAYDGWSPAAGGRRRGLDPVTAPFPIPPAASPPSRAAVSNTSSSTSSAGGGAEPEERKRLDRWSAVARSTTRRSASARAGDAGELPVRDDDAARRRLLGIADLCLDELVASSPRDSLCLAEGALAVPQAMLAWLAREAQNAGRSTPLHFEELRPAPAAAGEPHSIEPLASSSATGARSSVGQIRRIDRSWTGPRPARLQDGQGAARRRPHLPAATAPMSFYCSPWRGSSRFRGHEASSTTSTAAGRPLDRALRGTVRTILREMVD